MKQLGPAGPILALLLFLAPAAGTSQTAFLVRDINEGRLPLGNSSPQQFHAALGKVFFTASEPPNSWGGLWVTDGTDSGTRLLACPGACPAAWYFVGAVPGALIAAATSDGGELVLWRTDGTAPGTFPLTGPELGVELATEDVHRDLTNRLLHAGAVYFSGCEPVFGGACGLWKTDGTIAGTVLVELTGAPPSRLTALGSRFAFRAGEALWISDGTPAGTSVVQTFPGRSIEETAAAGGKLFFFIREGFTSQELWVSNGTEAGTRSVKSGAGGWLKAGERGVYFLAKGSSELNRLWFSDGTPGGTRLVTEIDVFFPEQLEEVGGRAVFLSRDNSVNTQLWAATSDPHSSELLVGPEEYIDSFLYKVGGRVLLFVEDENGRELRVTDGTRAGTRILDICPGACSGALSSHFLWSEGLLFTGRDEQNGDELWTTDGTSQGTRRLTSLPDGYRVPVIISPKAALLGDKLLFGASSPYGEELWVSQGPDDTRLVTDIAGDGSGSDPQDLVPVAGRVLFTACDDTGRKVWQSTGEREGTVSMGAPPGQSCGRDGDLAAVGGQAFYLTEEAELWRTDGSPGGERRLATSVAGIAALQDRLFFLAWTGGQAALWKTNGTQAGTVQVLGIPEVGDLNGLSAAGSELYFAVRDEDFLGSHIWRSDGTPAGTRKIATVEDSDVEGFVRAGPWVYFYEPQRNRLWRTDGTESGTSPLVPLDQSYGDPGSSMTEHGGLLYFLSDGTALWRSDGTAAGTLPIKTFAAPPHSNRPFSKVLISFGGRLAFAAYDPVHGIEPWLSDGTPAGTVLLKDVFPGEESSWPEGFTAAGGKLFFAAEDDVHGSELWQSDGTEAGTRMIHDIAPFARSSRPLDLTADGNRLYFSADDGETGRELWLLPLAETGCTPSAEHLCLGDGRFRVEASWRDFEGNQGKGTAMGLTADTGWFWFFSPSNVEVIVKVLDGTGLNGHRWVFYGALSSVEYSITVTDTETGLTRRYFNPIGQLASVGDTTGFGPLGAFSVAEPAPAVLAEEKAVAAAPCEATAERLCLNNQRFAVEVAWKDFAGNTGTGKAVNLTADTGYFWFFDAANVELVLKVLDGTALNGKHWVFYGALSSVEYTITVTDTQTGARKIYKNPSGRLASVADTGAF